jgi:hypothetical protein
MNDFPTANSGSRGGLKFKHIMLLLLLAFAGGGVATWWLANKYGAPTPPVAADAVETGSNSAAPSAGNVAPVQPSSVATPQQGDGQVMPVYVTDSTISGDAVRGEGLLLTYAVRRTLDNGAPLGYLAEQLQLRFGATQPQAVASVVSAAQAPVTLEMLQNELNGLSPVLLNGTPDASMWATVKRELSQLFVLRKDDVASLAPSQRLMRAQVLVEAGKLPAAMQEVASLPGASAAQSWLLRAKRYNDTRKALDRLEQMALIRPVVVPVPAPPPIEVPPPETEAPTP